MTFTCVFKSLSEQIIHTIYVSDSTLVTNGIPQGSSLGSLLFLVYINDLPNTVHYSQTGMYTDDTGPYATGLSISEIETSLNKPFSRLCLWPHANKSMQLHVRANSC